MAQGLTDQQRKFALEYLNNGHNATKAAIAAGYSPKTAPQQGTRLLKHVQVAAYLADKLAASAAKVSREHAGLELTAARVLGETMKLAFSDTRKVWKDDGSMLPPSEWPDDIAGAIAGVEIQELFEGQGKDRVQVGFTKKLKLWDKPRSLELLGKHLKLWTDVVEAKVDGLDDTAKAERAAELIAAALTRKGQAA